MRRAAGRGFSMIIGPARCNLNRLCATSDVSETVSRAAAVCLPRRIQRQSGDNCIGFGGMRIDRTVAQDADITLEAARDALASPSGYDVPRGQPAAAVVLGVKGKNNGSFASKYSC
jgi:hypothetical protein